MQEKKSYSGNHPSEIWAQVKRDMNSNGSMLHFEAQLLLPGSETDLVIDIDLGGGFQSGISTTSFRAVAAVASGFKFALHDETFLDEIGKFFGMQDVVIGYPEFDDLLIIKTDNEEKTRQVFADKPSRMAIQSLQNFSFYLEQQAEGPSVLNLIINEGVTNPDLLQQLHTAFITILKEVNQF